MEIMQFICHSVNDGSVQKKDEVLVKTLYEQKGYNAWQFMAQFLNKG